CEEGCEKRERPEERTQCRERCQEEFRREQEERGQGGHGNQRDPERQLQHCRQKCRSESAGTEQAIRFRGPSFHYQFKTQHGRVWILQRFTERSSFLHGVENYRMAILEADPQTLIVPTHFDAEAIFFVAEVSVFINECIRESFNLRRGDILRIPSGTTLYMINRDDDRKLVIVKLLQPMATPGHFEAFYSQSYFEAFSDELLEAALNARSEKFRRLFSQQGKIIKASKEQIRALSHHEEGGIWPFGSQSKSSYNIFDERPTRYYEGLEDLDIAVAFANMTQGSMIAPYYNSRTAKIAIVLRGEEYFEMAGPHLSSESEQGSEGSRRREQSGQSYQTVRANLRPGTAFVIPTSHPFTTVASQNQDLQIACFDINARNNRKFHLSGRRNIFIQLEREVKELAFGAPAREVDEVFQSQEDEFFGKGPSRRQSRSLQNFLCSS
ncbi:hypothetical protein NMG60_11034815, partial [Bertholletia excelsa]